MCFLPLEDEWEIKSPLESDSDSEGLTIDISPRDVLTDDDANDDADGDTLESSPKKQKLNSVQPKPSTYADIDVMDDHVMDDSKAAENTTKDLSNTERSQLSSHEDDRTSTEIEFLDEIPIQIPELSESENEIESSTTKVWRLLFEIRLSFRLTPSAPTWARQNKPCGWERDT